jgi:hypothetical protein
MRAGRAPLAGIRLGSSGLAAVAPSCDNAAVCNRTCEERFRQLVCKKSQAAFLVGSIFVHTAIPSLNRFPS